MRILRKARDEEKRALAGEKFYTVELELLTDNAIIWTVLLRDALVLKITKL